MDHVRTIDDQREAGETSAGYDESSIDAPPAIGSDERRMHVRAYNYWVSLLNGRAFPSLSDLDPASMTDFGPHAVLLDFSTSPEDPTLPWIGEALRREGNLGDHVKHISQVPRGSLVSRLTDHYLQIIANRAPIGFEAEFVTDRGTSTMYRGILMPFSSQGDAIDVIYGVINWKESAAREESAGIEVEVDRALRSAPARPLAGPVWADGPNATPLAERYRTDEEGDAWEAGEEIAFAVTEEEGLADRLAAARETASAMQGAVARSRSALYLALGLAYDFAMVAEARPDEYLELLEDAGLKQQARAPMTPVVKLVFGADYDKTRLTEFAAALAFGRRTAIPLGGFREYLERRTGGLKAVVADERRARRPAGVPEQIEITRAALRKAEPRATVRLDAGKEEFVLLFARREEDGSLSVLAPVPAGGGLVDRAIRSFAR